MLSSLLSALRLKTKTTSKQTNEQQQQKPKEKENYCLIVPGSYLLFSLLDTCNANAKAMTFKTAGFLASGL